MENKSSPVITDISSILFLGQGDLLKDRIRQIAQDLGENTYEVSDIDEVLAGSRYFPVVLVSFLGVKDSVDEQKSFLKLVRSLAPQSFIISVFSTEIEDSLKRDFFNLGANLIYSEESILNQSEIDFVLNKIVNFTYYPLSKWSIQPGEILPFSIYHIMPLNKKSLLLLESDTLTSLEDLKKINSTEELFVESKDIPSVHKHFDLKPSLTSQGVRRQLELSRWNMCELSYEIITSILHPEKTPKRQQIDFLLKEFEQLIRKVVIQMSSVQDSWSLIGATRPGARDFWNRHWVRALWAAHLSFASSMGEPHKVALASLLSNMGYYQLNVQIKKANIKNLFGESIDFLGGALDFKKHIAHSVQSLSTLPRQLKSTIEDIIRFSRERVDMKGYPSQVYVDEIRKDSMILHFVDMVDWHYLKGGMPMAVEEMRRKVYLEESTKLAVFTKDFIKTIGPIV